MNDAEKLNLLDASGKPVDTTDKKCPRCGASPKMRRLSGGFGSVHDICGNCGYDFPERTL